MIYGNGVDNIELSRIENALARNAKFAKNLKVGDRIQMWGRVQSRDYEKKLDNGEVEKRVAYEVSISKIKKLPENNIN